MTTFRAKGYTADEAFNNYPGFEYRWEETTSFHKSGLTLDEYIKESLANTPEGEGYYIVLKKPKKPVTKPKYKIENFKTEGTRKWVTMVNFVDPSGKVIESSSTKVLPKGKAILRAKELSAELKTVISLQLTKIVLGGNNTIAEVSIKEDDTRGEYIFYGIDNLVTSDETE